MSTAMIWVIIINLVAGILAFFIMRALYREVLSPRLERWKKLREERRKRV